MKVLHSLLCAAGLCLAPASLMAASEWQPLFDGKTLDGWMSWNTREPLQPGAWQVVDGTLALTAKKGGDIYTAQGYTDYELELEWKTMGNSGIFLRVDPEAPRKQRMWNRSPELQVLKDDPASLKSTSAGGVYALYDFTEPKVFDPDGWNNVRVRCHDDTFTIWFNGQQTAQFTVGSDEWKARIADSKFKKFPGFAQRRDGHIGLQDHGAKVQYRNLRIRELDAPTP